MNHVTQGKSRESNKLVVCCVKSMQTRQSDKVFKYEIWKQTCSWRSVRLSAAVHVSLLSLQTSFEFKAYCYSVVLIFLSVHVKMSRICSVNLDTDSHTVCRRSRFVSSCFWSSSCFGSKSFSSSGGVNPANTLLHILLQIPEAFWYFQVSFNFPISSFLTFKDRCEHDITY